MLCKHCLRTRTRSFFKDGACEDCDPTAVGTFSGLDLSHVLAMARAYCTTAEWVTDAAARDKGVPPSSQIVKGMQFPPTLPGADECEAWLRGLLATPEELCSDYENSIVLLARKGRVSDEDWSLAVGIYHAWTKTLKDEDAKPVPTGMWLGEPKQRLDIAACQCTEVKSLGVSAEHPEWGARFLIRFTAASGHDLVWFTGEGGTFDPRPGETYNIRATIKSHDEYEGHRSTIITRVAES